MTPYNLLLAALAFRAVTVICGFASLYLGYRLFVKGVLDQTELEGNLHDSRLVVRRAAPGIFFCCLGACVMISAIWRTPIRYESGPDGSSTVVSVPKGSDEAKVAVQPASPTKVIIEVPEDREQKMAVIPPDPNRKPASPAELAPESTPQ